MKKKLFTALLTILVVFACMPINVKANELIHITYDINGGTGETPVDENEYEIGEEIYLFDLDFFEPEFENGDRPFLYWSTNENYVEGEEEYSWYTDEFEEDTTLYARWGYELVVNFSNNYLNGEEAAFTCAVTFDVVEGTDVYDYLIEKFWNEEEACWYTDDSTAFGFTAFELDGFTTDPDGLVDIADDTLYAIENVEVYAKLTNIKTPIIVNEAEHGYITASKEEALGDETFDVKVYADEGYILNEIEAEYNEGSFISTVYWELDSVDQTEFKDKTNNYAILTLTPNFGKIIKASDIVKAGEKGLEVNAGDYILMDIEEIGELTVYSMEAAICLGKFENFTKEDFLNQGGNEEDLNYYAYKYLHSEQYYTDYELEVGKYCKVLDYYTDAVNILDEEDYWGCGGDKYNIVIDEDGNIEMIGITNELGIIDFVNGEVNGSCKFAISEGKADGLTIHISEEETYYLYDWEEEKYSGVVVKNGSTVLTEGQEYNVEEGSIVIDFDADYINSLKPGNYDFTITFGDTWGDEIYETYNFNLVVNKYVPDTAVNNNLAKAISLLSLMSIIALMFVKKKD